MKIQPVVVIYNKSCSESLSLTSLKGQSVMPVVVDNSTKENSNEQYCQENGLQYISMNGNAGLSKAYNRALEKLATDIDYVLWLDDDTELPDNYIDSLEKQITDHPQSKVFVPLVKTNREDRGLLSPSLLVGTRTFRINSLDVIKTKRFSAINSGMVVNRKVYDDYRYDEQIFLDCLDHDFMIYCWNNDIPICVMENVVVRQNFSGDQKSSKKSKLTRFKIFAKDFKRYRKKNGASKVGTEMLLIKRFINVVR